MKKVISLLLVFILTFSVMQMVLLSDDLFMIEAQAKENDKSVVSIEIEQSPNKTDYYYEIDGYLSYYYDELNLNGWEYFYYQIDTGGLVIKINYSDGSSEYSDKKNPYYFNDNEIIIENQTNGEIWNIGYHDVLVTYLGKSASFEVKIIENPVESIELVCAPSDTTLIENVDGYYSTYYFQNDDWDYEEIKYFRYYLYFSNFKLKYNLKNGTSVIGSENYFTYQSNIIGQEDGEIWGIGEHTATLELMDCTVDFPVTIVESPVKSIRVVSLPDKIEYFEGIDGIYANSECYNSILIVDGLKFEIKFSDGTKKTVDTSYCYQTDDNSYWFEIPLYNYINSDTVLQIGENEIKVSFMGKTTSFKVKLSENPYSKIEFKKLNIKDEYLKNEYPDISGSEIIAYKKDGSSQIFNINRENTYNHYGEYCWKLSCENNEFFSATEYSFEFLGFTLEINVIRNETFVRKFSFINEPQNYYGVGSRIELTLSNGKSIQTVINDFSEQGAGEIGDYNCTSGLLFTDYGVFEASYRIKTGDSIETTDYEFIFGSMDNTESNLKYHSTTNMLPKLCYLSDEMLSLITGSGFFKKNKDFDGVYFDNEFNSNNIDAIIFASNWLFGDTDNQTCSREEITDIVDGFFNIDNFDLSVSQNYEADKDEYCFQIFGGFGEVPPKKSYEIVEYKNTTRIIETMAYDTIIYKNYYIFDENNRLIYLGTVDQDKSEISIESLPNKTDYFEGDEINTEGLILKYTDIMGECETVTEGYAVCPQKASVGTEEITISYKNKDVKIPINVSSLEETGIELLTPPSKLIYDCGDVFNPAGLQIILQYNNGNEKVITENLICSPKYLTVSGNQTITVYYHGFSTTFSVKVNEKEGGNQGKIKSVFLENVSLDYKSTIKLNPIIDCNDGAEYKIEYQSSNPNIVTVDQNGNIYGEKKGNATITCTVTDETGNTVKCNCDVNVGYSFLQWIIIIVLFGWIWY